MARLKVCDVAKAYVGVQALDNLDLTVEHGELFSLLGPSGCGKTTLLRIIAGFVSPSSGRVWFDEDDVTEVPPHSRNIGMVFQDYALFPDRSVFENVAFGLKARRIDRTQRRKRVNDILSHMGLTALADRSPGALSGGQRQRVAMARALVIRPRILLLDEPLSALDAKLRAELRTSIRDIQREFAITTVFVTHDQDEALSISDRIALMDRGRIVQLGTPADIYDQPANAFSADFLGGANLLPIDRIRPNGVIGSAEIGMGEHQFAVRCVDPSVASAPSESLRLCIRPEAWSPEPAGPPSPNTLFGRVRHKEFLGSQIAYQVELTNGVIVRSIEFRRFRQVPLDVEAGVALKIPDTATVLSDVR